jgi:uncharacterized C2H2 Zn-finger protein
VSARRKRWSGSFIVVWSDNSWEFFRCCRCGQLLEDPKSRARGLGPECVKHAPIDLIGNAKRQDRARMRAELRSARWVAMRQTGRAESNAGLRPESGPLTTCRG